MILYVRIMSFPDSTVDMSYAATESVNAQVLLGDANNDKMTNTGTRKRP